MRYFAFFLFSISSLAQECPLGMYQVQGHFRQSHYRNEHYVSQANISSYCKHYRSEGPLKLKFRQNQPKAWPKQKEKFKECPIKRQNEIKKNLSELPKILTDVGELKIHCADKSMHDGNPATTATKVKIIVLYDLAFSGDIKRYLGHELAHILYDRLADDELKELHKVLLWDEHKKSFHPKRKNFSEEDGSSDPDEDFANNVEHYLFEKESFKIKFPEIYRWIDNFWGRNK
jgi:hypothetical protein